MDKYYIPQYLDQPFKVIFWTLDEVAAFLILFVCLLTIFDSPIMGIFSGIFSVLLLKKLKGEEGHYFLAHLAYWHLPPFVMYKTTPHSYIREILG
jgi:conjugal transfer pilus assembly protein TraL